MQPIFGLGLLVVVVLYLISRYSQGQTLEQRLDESDYSYLSGSGRTAPPSSENWRAQEKISGDSLDKAGHILEDLKQQSDVIAAKSEVTMQKMDGESPAKDLSDLAPLQLKARAIALLNKRRGQQVRIKTEDGTFHTGKVVTLTGNQVMLRDADGNVNGVDFENMVRIS